MNTFGTRIRLTTFGESHGPAMGGILDGMPSMLAINLIDIQNELDKRRPGIAPGTSPRKEADKVEILSGLTSEGVTLGSPIGFIVRNHDAKSRDYDGYIGKFRPNHADYTYYKKYGIHDFRGGGRSSARETVSWVVGGAITRQWLIQLGIRIKSQYVETNNVEEARKRGDTVGGIVKCTISGLPAGIGEPVFDKLQSRLAAAIMSINAVKAFEYGDGFKSAYSFGTEFIDSFIKTDKKLYTTDDVNLPTDLDLKCVSNHSGGIQGGISNGMDINFTVYFKPTPTLGRPVNSYDINGNRCIIEPKGRHDACVAIRGAAVVEAMASLTVSDLIAMRYV